MKPHEILKEEKVLSRAKKIPAERHFVDMFGGFQFSMYKRCVENVSIPWKSKSNLCYEITTRRVRGVFTR